MEQFKKSLFEVYMNYDTLQFLKEENEKQEDIISMFKEELDYSKDLTETLLKYDKSFLKSVAMRIKLKLKHKANNDTIKNEILDYDQSLSPLLEKLIKSNSFVNQYNEIDLENKEVLENKPQDNSEAEENDENLNNINIFIDNCINFTDKPSDSLKVSELYKVYCDYCDEEKVEKETKSDFKNYLGNIWGESTKGSYQGYKLSSS